MGLPIPVLHPETKWTIEKRSSLFTQYGGATLCPFSVLSRVVTFLDSSREEHASGSLYVRRIRDILNRQQSVAVHHHLLLQRHDQMQGEKKAELGKSKRIKIQQVTTVGEAVVVR
ncbi:Hypothetical predicted protein [Podarcis lilfordi]|uniref:Uncharacterized protein n=1 Tax=Podarcis lilfordi TaxID=74358 RepID=A0AA35KAM0_9SAUR|nr:Hypothetical predicted protein [Podarcis lilfordi]